MRCVPGTPTHHPTTTTAQGKAPVVVGHKTPIPFPALPLASKRGD